MGGGGGAEKTGVFFRGVRKNCRHSGWRMGMGVIECSSIAMGKKQVGGKREGGGRFGHWMHGRRSGMGYPCICFELRDF